MIFSEEKAFAFTTGMQLAYRADAEEDITPEETSDAE